MMQFFRAKALRSELYSYIRDMARSQGLQAKNAHNAETPKMRGADTLAKMAVIGGAAVGGYALGKSIGKMGLTGFDNMRQRFTKDPGTKSS